MSAIMICIWIVTCRWGMLGALTVWGIFGVLCAGGLVIAAQCKDPFGRLVPVGLVAVFFSQMAINTGMTIGIMPITGMTLPFVSAGGSSLVSAWIMVRSWTLVRSPILSGASSPRSTQPNQMPTSAARLTSCC